MAEAPVFQQMYTDRRQISTAWEPSEKPHSEPPKQYFIYFVLPMLLGALLCSVPLASLLTLYLQNQC